MSDAKQALSQSIAREPMAGWGGIMKVVLGLGEGNSELVEQVT